MSGTDRHKQIRARVGLVLALIGTGWLPPVEVREQMERDERSLRRLGEPEPRDAALWPVDPGGDGGYRHQRLERSVPQLRST